MKRERTLCLKKVPQQLWSMVMVFAMIANYWVPTEGTSVPSYAAIGMNAYSRTLAMSSTGYFPVRNDEGMYGLANVLGEMSVGYSYSYIGYISGDFFVATENQGSVWQRYVINSSGTVVYNLSEKGEYAYNFGNYLVLSPYNYGNPPFQFSLSGMQSATSRYELRFYDQDFQEVPVAEAYNNTNPYDRSLDNYRQEVEVDETGGFRYTVTNSQGVEIIPPSSQGLQTSYWNEDYSQISGIAYYKDFHGHHISNIIGVQGVDSNTGEKITYHVDIVNGIVYDTIRGQHTSTIDANGYYIYETEDERFAVGHSTASWLGADLTDQPVQSPLPTTPGYNNQEDFDLPNIPYTDLLQGVKYVSYSIKIPNVTADSYLAYGDLPVGLGLYDDGVLGGIPRETGIFSFVVQTTQGQVGYTIEVVQPNPWSVEQRNDFDILQYIPTVSSNEGDLVFWVTGGFYQFLNLYIDGVLLEQNVHYTITEGSTRIVVNSDIVSTLSSGSHTINATFEKMDSVTGTPLNKGNSSQVTVNNVAQVFEKTVTPEAVPMPFTDVNTTDWHYDYVKFVYQNNIFYGVSDLLFMPNTSMSRSMMATILYAKAGRPTTSSAGFSDVPDGLWYSDAVNWVGVRGIDDSVGTFRPDEPILREEAAKMVYNFCTDQGIFLPQTTSLRPNDLNSVSANAQTAVTALFSQGVFSGKLDNNFEPQSSLTRAETSAMMKTFLETIS